MSAAVLHPRIRAPVVEKGNVVSQLVLDLTVYLVEPSVDEFDMIFDLYQQVCPKKRIVAYAMDETVDWDDVESPILTRRGRDAERLGIPFPFVEVVRQRIRDGRDFSFQLWDACDVDSFALSVRRVRVEEEKHAFARFLFPVDTDPAVLRTVASELADAVRLYSGHGGYCLSYDAWRKFRGFSVNYGRAKRWWGLDLEDLNGTLPLMKDRIKGAQWITILGSRFLEHVEAVTLLDTRLSEAVTRERCMHGAVLVAGPRPVVGDQHQPDPGLDAYESVALAVESITVDQHPDFDGEHFTNNGDTVGWLRRFVDSDGWR